MKKTIIASLLFSFSAFAQTPTIVYGSAETAEGGQDDPPAKNRPRHREKSSGYRTDDPAD